MYDKCYGARLSVWHTYMVREHVHLTGAHCYVSTLLTWSVCMAPVWTSCWARPLFVTSMYWDKQLYRRQYGENGLDIWSWYFKWYNCKCIIHDDIITWTPFLHYWPFVRGINQPWCMYLTKGLVMWSFDVVLCISCWMNGAVGSNL